jgi:hypothetical protein
MTTEICGLGYVGFDTPNVDAWIDFGPRVLGMSLAPSQPDGTVRLRYDDYHHRIALHPAPEHRLAYIGWETANHGDLDIVATRLNDAGFDIEEGDDETCTSRVVQRLIRFVDPSGFNHEVFFGAGYRLRSFHPGRKHGGFVTGNQGMGHIVLLVPDLAPALDLFENLLKAARLDAETASLGRSFAATNATTQSHLFSTRGFVASITSMSNATT